MLLSNSLNDSGSWNLSVNPFQIKCLIQSNYFSSNIGYALKENSTSLLLILYFCITLSQKKQNK